MNAACQAPLSSTNARSLLGFMSIESAMPSNHLILCRPLLLFPSVSPTIRVFSNESAVRIRRPKYWSFSISPSNEYSGLISFRMATGWVLFPVYVLTCWPAPVPRQQQPTGAVYPSPALSSPATLCGNTAPSTASSKTEIYLIYSIVLVSGIWQSDSVICFFRWFSNISYCQILNIVPWAIQ